MHEYQNTLIQEIALGLNIIPQQLDLSISFACNGGDSLSAISVASSCRAKQLPLTVAMLMGSDSVDCVIRELDKAVEGILLCSRAPSNPHHEPTGFTGSHQLVWAPATTTHDNDRVSPATDMQISLMHGSMAQPGRNIIRYCETYRTGDIPQVKRAWLALATTEPIFRTVLEGHEHAYLVAEAEHPPFMWEEKTVYQRDSFEYALSRHSPDTKLTGNAFQVVHLRMGDRATESKVIWSTHHALMDGYSSVLLLNKHRAILSGGAPSPSRSFVSLLGKVAAFRQGQKLASYRFWEKQERALHAAKGELLLPRLMSPVTSLYAREDIVLDITGAELLNRARAARVTVATLFYTAWALVLSRYVDSDCVLFGVVLSGRTIPIVGAQEVVEPLINSVPFLITLQPSANSVDFLQSVFKQSIDLETFQWEVPDRYKMRRFPSMIDIHFEAPTSGTTGLPGL
ncbi:hypothetical protein PG997_010041 [Apiospora hydei]|uniref:Condensation domain-containing protein n=1 Tax=Apiospora hydei TaxID=1337664 RepID=A0ABR1VZU4_9PEZI